MSTTTVDRGPGGLREHLAGLSSLALASCLAVTTEMLPVGLLPHIGTSFHVDDSVTGLLVSLYAVMVAVLAVPLTLLTARMPRKPLLLTTVLCYAVSNALVAVVNAFNYTRAVESSSITRLPAARRIEGSAIKNDRGPTTDAIAQVNDASFKLD